MTSPVLACRESGTEGIRPNKNLRAVEASAIQNPSEHSSLLSGTRSRNRIDRVSSIFQASLRLLRYVNVTTPRIIPGRFHAVGGQIKSFWRGNRGVVEATLAKPWVEPAVAIILWLIWFFT